MKEVFTSTLANVGVHPSGWHRMKSGKWITRVPIWDFSEGIFGRLGHGVGSKFLLSRGLRIATVEELRALHDEGLHIEPYTLPTVAMLKADGIANTEKAIQAYRTRYMMGLDWAHLHDAVVFSRLQSAGWDGGMCVDNCGKHFAAGGLIFGWWKANGSMIQTVSAFHKNDGTYVDYGTTIHAVSDTDPTGKDYGPAKAPGGSVVGSVVGAVKSAASEAARVLGALLGGGGGELPKPAPVAAKPAPVQSKQVPMTPDSPHASSFVQARNFRKGRLGKVTLVVLHDMEAAESAKTAENVAAWFAGPASPMASAHYNVDSDSIVQSVRETDTAFHAPGANAQGIGIEMAGYARQSAAEWNDTYSTAMLDRASSLVADICKRHGIPVQFVDSPGLLAGVSGITTHAAVSKAWKKSTHTDPGANFPIAEFLVVVRAKMG